MSSIMIDRGAPRTRPEEPPFMHQNWEDFLFLSWPIDPTPLRALIPETLEIDTFRNLAWVTLTPFRVTGLRFLSAPPVPGLAEFGELNFRTYVRHQRTPGIWFLSLDASNILPVLGARLFFDLPYHAATIQAQRENGRFTFSCQRATDDKTEFTAAWRAGRMMPASDVDSLPYFLTERYYVYSGPAGALRRTQVNHSPWTLTDAEVSFHRNSLFSTHKLTQPTMEPVAYASKQLNVEFWPPEPLLDL